MYIYIIQVCIYDLLYSKELLSILRILNRIHCIMRLLFLFLEMLEPKSLVVTKYRRD